MDVNYLTVAVLLLVVIIGIIFLILRNRKDKRNFEKEMSESEIKPEKHEENHPG